MLRSPRVKSLTDNECLQIVAHLCEFATKGMLERGAIASAMALFQRSRSSIKEVWRTKGAFQRGTHPGRPTVYTAAAVKEKLESASLEQRGSIRAVAGATGISKSTVQRNMKAKE